MCRNNGGTARSEFVSIENRDDFKYKLEPHEMKGSVLASRSV